VEEKVISAPFPRWHRPLALAVLVVICLALFSNLAFPRQTDFIAYWAASRLALHGHAAAAYDLATLTSVQATAAASRPEMPFGYPPPFLLVVLPFGLIPYTGAAMLWVGTTGVAYLAVARKLASGSVWLAAAFAPVAVNGIIGQNGLLTAALVIGAVISLDRRPFVAGLLVGCLIIKPQLAVLFPLAFLADGRWRAIAGAATSAIGLSLLALVCFGWESYRAMAVSMPLFVSIVSSGTSGWFRMASVYSALRLAGIDAQIAWAAHALVAFAAAVMVWAVWRGRHDTSAKCAMLVAASMLVSPYLYVYDTAMLVVPLFWLAANGADRRVLAVVWLLPVMSFFQNWWWNGTVNLAPLVPIGLVILMGVRLFSVERPVTPPSRAIPAL
jgi:hypothetical protein